MIYLSFFIKRFLPFIPRGCHREYSSQIPIKSILIANRGEIACRVMRTAKKMGIKSVAVYSDADKNSLHVSMADQAYHIGPPAVQQSYLRGDKILDAAKNSGAEAIHPGYGFLSENAEFADLCEKNGISFIGPPSSAIRDMGIKSTSKYIMSNAGVPIIGGYHGEDQSDQKLLKEAKKIGFPVMIKAVRGGGGKGMRISLSEENFLEQLNSAKTEAMKSFGDQVMLIEKFVERPRHVEVQVFGDKHDNYVYLFERDCSVQRRHQKIIEEAPGPGITTEVRKNLGEAAVKAARAVKYVGAGTVEFIMDPNYEFYFMEMNTRLQVEHPVSEMITDTDLVEWQIRVAAGEKLPVTQSDLSIQGHSFEARIYAEDPSNNFMPGAGLLKRILTPEPSKDVRIETGVREGDEVSVHYDPMIAKLVVWGQNRSLALTKLSSCLSKFNVVGLSTNIGFLQKLSHHPKFSEGDVHTDFIPDHQSELFPETKVSSVQLAQASLGIVLNAQEDVLRNISQSSDPNSPFRPSGTQRLNHNLIKKLVIKNKDQKFEVVIEYLCDGKFFMTMGDSKHQVEGRLINNGNELDVSVDGISSSFRVIKDQNQIHLFTSNDHIVFSEPVPKFQEAVGGGSNVGEGLAPMPGVVEKICVEEGQKVNVGDPLVVIIAMKMEYVIKATISGIVEKIYHPAGQSVPKDAPLVKLKPIE